MSTTNILDLNNRIDELEKNSGSYTDLPDKPQINGVTLSGNKTASDLGLQEELTFDNVPTDGSNNPVKSDGIYDSEKDIYAVMGKMGAKNLLFFPYDDPDGTVSHNVTYTVNNDGTVSAIGKCDNEAASTFFFDKFSTDQMWLKPGKYIFSGAPEGNTEGYIWARIYHNDNTNTLYSATTGSFIFEVDDTDINIRCGIAFNINTGDDNISRLFKPMLRLASDTDDTYQPYAKTNMELTKALDGLASKTYGTAVDITAATQTEPYTCPSDGVVNIQSGYASANYTALFKVGWTGFMAIAKGNESQANGAMTVPVLKGDQLYIQSSGADPVANYYPYVTAI